MRADSPRPLLLFAIRPGCSIGATLLESSSSNVLRHDQPVVRPERSKPTPRFLVRRRANEGVARRRLRTGRFVVRVRFTAETDFDNVPRRLAQFCRGRGNGNCDGNTRSKCVFRRTCRYC